MSSIQLQSIFGKNLYPRIKTSNVINDAGFLAVSDSGEDGQFLIQTAEGPKWVSIQPSQIQTNYKDFSDALQNLVVFAGLSVPVGLQTSFGNYYPIEENSLYIGSNSVTLDITSYLAYEGIKTITGQWRAYFAAGKEGPAGFSPYIGENGNWFDENGDTGVSASVSGAYIDFSSVDASGKFTFSSANTIPVSILTSSGNIYPIQKGSLQVDKINATVTINVEPYLVYDGVSQFSGIWRLYLAAGSTPGLTAYVYGVDRDESVSSPTLGMRKVVLNADGSYTYENFAKMPAHNLRRCVVSSLGTRNVAYYLHPTNSQLKEDGTAADLTGTDGDVMVEIPVGYYRIDRYTDSNLHEHTVKLISDRPFPGSAPFPAFYVSNGGETLQKQYIGAFRASIDANNKCRSVTGVKPAFNKSRTAFRTSAVSNGGTLVNFLIKCWLGWLAEIEFASTDTQSSISVGFSELSNYSTDYLRYCGRTVSLGNGTGEITADTTGVDADLETHWISGASKVVSCSYRGVEDPWGVFWEIEDGIQKYQDQVSDSYTKSGYWFTTDISKYQLLDVDKGYGDYGTLFPFSGYTGADIVWVSHAWPKVIGYIKSYDPLTYFPTNATGGSTTYLCDYVINYAIPGGRILMRGGATDGNVGNGAFFLAIDNPLDSMNVGLGSRLAC